jgi:hypothetical protein
MGWARRLSEWRDEHHDCDCPAGQSCGCQELRELNLEIECSTISDAEFDRMAQDGPDTPSGDGLVEVLKKARVAIDMTGSRVADWAALHTEARAAINQALAHTPVCRDSEEGGEA